MANTKSAEKRARQAKRSQVRNRWYRSRARTFIKRARLEIEAGNVEAASAAVIDAERALDRAAQKGAIHSNNASRRKSRLAQALKRISG